MEACFHHRIKNSHIIFIHLFFLFSSQLFFPHNSELIFWVTIVIYLNAEPHLNLHFWEEKSEIYLSVCLSFYTL